ncbi:type II toxin-antitoxin system PemK/MazF family toxin [Desulfofundulus salinus]|uniref:type II toxin-antitoxin system PemK/MazF family toxin n=1 Tax=Desulfofundulus salinus TaxID=2419843 RepID=UPI001FAA0CD9|nr:type II toxin-antitoxin system PemK/MazF family toxin [Desulfofundulus salinum]
MVVVKDMPYKDIPGGKTRPSVVLSSYEHNKARQDLVVAKISGSAVAGKWDLKIERWLEAGLKKPSKVVCDHITVVSKVSVRTIGRLDAETLAGVREKITLLFGL